MLQAGQINQIIDALIVSLFKAENDRLKKRELEMVSENRKISIEHFDGFFYQGQYYTDLDRTLAAKGIKSGLHPSLVPQMERHIKDKREVEFDRLRVKQALALVLKGCRTAQDLRDALPNQLADMIDQIKSMPRSRPEGFTIMDDPRKFKQYQTLREKIDFYTTTRLLY